MNDARSLGGVPIDQVGTEEVLAFLKPMRLSRSETAGRLRARIEDVLSPATANGLRSGPNPAAWRVHHRPGARHGSGHRCAGCSHERREGTPAARVSAANSILDRGFGKSVQKMKREQKAADEMNDAELIALIREHAEEDAADH